MLNLNFKIRNMLRLASDTACKNIAIEEAKQRKKEAKWPRIETNLRGLLVIYAANYIVELAMKKAEDGKYSCGIQLDGAIFRAVQDLKDKFGQYNPMISHWDYPYKSQQIIRGRIVKRLRAQGLMVETSEHDKDFLKVSW